MEKTNLEWILGSGYKAQELLDLEEGKLLSLGSKEIEISGAIDQDEWQTKVRKTT